MANRPIITLTTDFGVQDHFVGTLKGVILGLLPDAQIVDISHSIQAFDLLDGSLTIAQAYKYFPNGTVHMVVVDPGVGTARRPVIASSEKHRFVAPDNGVLSSIYAQEQRMRVHHVTSEHYFLQPVSSTFHARDIFAPVAANLARGIDSAQFGPEITDYVRFNLPRPKPAEDGALRGIVLKVDRFGNLITNIAPQDAPGLFQATPVSFSLKIGNREITQRRNAYAEAAMGEVFIIAGSMGYVEIAANKAPAAQLLGVSKGAEVMLKVEPAARSQSSAT